MADGVLVSFPLRSSRGGQGRSQGSLPSWGRLACCWLPPRSSLDEADQSQRLDRNMPRRRTSRSPSIGIYPAPQGDEAHANNAHLLSETKLDSSRLHDHQHHRLHHHNLGPAVADARCASALRSTSCSDAMSHATDCERGQSQRGPDPSSEILVLVSHPLRKTPPSAGGIKGNTRSLLERVRG
eukprot:9466685-Pyramimonas_sp.AAC.1